MILDVTTLMLEFGPLRFTGMALGGRMTAPQGCDLLLCY